MKRSFTVPDNLAIIAKEVVLAVIASIPAEWPFLRGTLHAPGGMLASGRALSTTKLVFGSPINQMIVKVGNDQTADVFGVLIEGKKPESVEFGHLGYCEVMPMEQSKYMAAHFIQLGYRGRLVFRWRDSEDREPVPLECEIWVPTQNLLSLPIFHVTCNIEESPEHGAIIAPVLAVLNTLEIPESRLVRVR